MSIIRVVGLMWLSSVLLAAVEPAQRASDALSCSDRVSNALDHPDTYYAKREDRCEGVFTELHNAPVTPFRLVLLGNRKELLKDATRIVVGWNPVAVPVLLQGESFGPPGSKAYAVRTTQNGAKGAYSWSRKVMAQAEIDPSRLSLTASISKSGGTKIYIPISIGPREAPLMPAAVDLELTSTSAMSELSVTLGQELADGSSKVILDRALQGGPWFELRPIPISLGALPNGRYRIEVGGKTTKNGLATFELQFQVGGDDSR